MGKYTKIRIVFQWMSVSLLKGFDTLTVFESAISLIFEASIIIYLLYFQYSAVDRLNAIKGTTIFTELKFQTQKYAFG